MASEQHHMTPLKTFLKVYATLIALTILTVAAAQVNLGHFNTPIAMLIATAKALIVMLWFMHLKHDTRLNRLTICSAFFFLLLFFGFTATDVFTRKNLQDVSIEHLTEKVKAEEANAPAAEPAPPGHTEHTEH